MCAAAGTVVVGVAGRGPITDSLGVAMVCWQLLATFVDSYFSIHLPQLHLPKSQLYVLIFSFFAILLSSRY